MELSSPYPRSPLPVPFPLQTPSVISDQTQIDEQSSTDLNRNYRTSSAPTRLPPLSSLQLPEFDVSKLRAANAPEKRHSSSARRMSLKKSDVVVRRRTSSVPVSSQIDSRRDHYSNSPSLRPVSADVGHLEPTYRTCDCCGSFASRSGPRGKNTLCSCCGLSYLRKVKGIKQSNSSFPTEQGRAKLDDDFIKVRRSYMEHKRIRDAVSTASSNFKDDAEEYGDFEESSRQCDTVDVEMESPTLDEPTHEPNFARIEGSTRSSSVDTFGVPYFQHFAGIGPPSFGFYGGTPPESPTSSANSLYAFGSCSSTSTLDSGYGGRNTAYVSDVSGSLHLQYQAPVSVPSSRKNSLAFLCD